MEDSRTEWKPEAIGVGMHDDDLLVTTDELNHFLFADELMKQTGSEVATGISPPYSIFNLIHPSYLMFVQRAMA